MYCLGRRVFDRGKDIHVYNHEASSLGDPGGDLVGVIDFQSRMSISCTHGSLGDMGLNEIVRLSLSQDLWDLTGFLLKM